jgi:hypothetical protein
VSDVNPGSLLYRFHSDAEDDVLLGANAADPDGDDFTPGGTYSGVTLQFWAVEAGDETTAWLQPGAEFTVWYGGDIGSGVVTGVLNSPTV